MGLSKEEIEGLIKSVALTRPEEATCDECLTDLAEFAERSLQGKSIPESLQAIEHHLAICAECQEEYQALFAALREVD